MKENSRPINVGISDLLSFRWPITAIASIAHRIAGAALFVGIGFGLFALDVSLSSEAGFEMLNAMLADAAVVISIALQHGIPAAALAKSIGRLPSGPVTPADLEGPGPGRVPASPIGAAVDLLRRFEEN